MSLAWTQDKLWHLHGCWAIQGARTCFPTREYDFMDLLQLSVTVAPQAELGKLDEVCGYCIHVQAMMVVMIMAGSNHVC